MKQKGRELQRASDETLESQRDEPAQFDSSSGCAPGKDSSRAAAPRRPSAPAPDQGRAESGRPGRRRRRQSSGRVGRRRGRGPAGTRGGWAGPGRAARCPLVGGKRTDDERDVVQRPRQHPSRGGVGEQERPCETGRADFQHSRPGGEFELHVPAKTFCYCSDVALL